MAHKAELLLNAKCDHASRDCLLGATCETADECHGLTTPQGNVQSTRRFEGTNIAPPPSSLKFLVCGTFKQQAEGRTGLK
eukprot:3006101-Amphidinium_carterae.1